MTITFRQLEVFKAVAELRSFTKAGRELRVSQSTISQHVRLLEESIQNQVFDRNRKNVSLTNAGEQLLKYSWKIFHLLEEAEIAVQTEGDPFSGPIAVGCGYTSLLYQLPKVLKEYTQRFPKVILQLTSFSLPELCDHLRTGALELAVAFEPISGTDFQKHPLCDESFVIAVSRHHPLAKRTDVRLSNLVNDRFILLRHGSNTHRIIGRYLAKKKIKPRLIMEFEHAEVVKELVAQGLGVSILPASAMATNPRSREIQTFPLNIAEIRRSLVAFYLRSKPMRPPVKAFFDLLCEHLGEKSDR